MGFVEAFEKFGAQLKNPQWSVSAENAKGEMVLSLWEHHFKKPVDGVITCKSRIDNWSGAGNNEFRENIKKAFETQQTIRVVVAKSHNIEAWKAGKQHAKTFNVKPTWVGKVVELNDEFIIEFREG